MIAALALSHYDVDDATESAAVFGFDSRTLHLHFLDEVKGNVGMRIPTDNVGGRLTFHQVGVFGIGTAGNRISEGVSVAAVARRGAPGAVRHTSATHQRFVGGRRGKLDDRLE